MVTHSEPMETGIFTREELCNNKKNNCPVPCNDSLQMSSCIMMNVFCVHGRHLTLTNKL